MVAKLVLFSISDLFTGNNVVFLVLCLWLSHYSDGQRLSRYCAYGDVGLIIVTEGVIERALAMLLPAKEVW